MEIILYLEHPVGLFASLGAISSIFFSFVCPHREAFSKEIQMSSIKENLFIKILTLKAQAQASLAINLSHQELF